MKNTKIDFETEYKTLDQKLNFLKSFNLINLQKAGKIGNISKKQLQTKDAAIKSILKFDLKNKFLICKTIFNNENEYRKEKIDNNQILRTLELNQYQFDNMKTKEWNALNENEREITTQEKNKDLFETTSSTRMTRNSDLKKSNFQPSQVFHSKKLNDDSIKFTIRNKSLNSRTDTQLDSDIKNSLDRMRFNLEYEKNKNQFLLLKKKIEIQKRTEKKLNELRRQKRLQEILMEAQRIAISKNIIKVASSSRTNSYHSNNFESQSNNKKAIAMREIDKLLTIDECEFKDDFLNNKRILIFKGTLK